MKNLALIFVTILTADTAYAQPVSKREALKTYASKIHELEDGIDSFHYSLSQLAGIHYEPNCKEKNSIRHLANTIVDLVDRTNDDRNLLSTCEVKTSLSKLTAIAHAWKNHTPVNQQMNETLKMNCYRSEVALNIYGNQTKQIIRECFGSSEDRQ